ncbi:MAG: ThiF family adenylyltransferase [Candidatus Eisenbacteria bacterium]
MRRARIAGRLYPAAAGVGRIGLVDFDAVEESNLQRQIAHGSERLGWPKLESMRQRLTELNPKVAVETHDLKLDRTNARAVVAQYDVVLDGSDNFPTRYLVNDACALERRPLVYGSILRFEGQASVFDARTGPCYRCLFPQPPEPGAVPSCAEAGVLGVLPGVIGSIQATEALKLLLGAGETLLGRLLLYDAWTLRFRELRLARDPACPLCGEAPTITELVDYDDFCGVAAVPAGAHAGGAFTWPAPGEIGRASAADVIALRARGEAFTLLDVREPFERALASIPGSADIPLGVLPLQANTLDAGRPVVVMCHHGARSFMAAQWLTGHGFTSVVNLEGGIHAWADVDPAVPRY